MGPYNNDTGNYEPLNEVENAHWLIHAETGQLCIIGRDEDGFESYGAEEEMEDILFNCTDDELADAEYMALHGFELVSPALRRFSPDIGYYHA